MTGPVTPSLTGPLTGPLTRRSGASLAELVLVAWLFALVLAAAARFIEAQGRLAAMQHDRTRGAEAVRAASLILAGELRYLAPGDLAIAVPESLGVRAVRGVGVVCRADGPHLLVRYRGVRLPEPAKDSVTLVTARAPAGMPPIALVDAAPDTACGGTVRLTLEVPAPHPAAVALLHETGSYHLNGGAVRYRIGQGGRQPLTEAVFGEAAFRTAAPGPGLSLGIRLHQDSLPRLGTARYDIPLRMLNGGTP